MGKGNGVAGAASGWEQGSQGVGLSPINAILSHY